MLEHKQPLVSVIVPVYNVAKYLRKCMDSLCEQSYRNLQIIAVDDGSTDESLSILREYEAKDSRVEVVHQENAGLSVARNTGLIQARGEWITGLDSDDYLARNAYEIILSKLDPQADIVCYAAQPIDEKGKNVSLHIMDVLFDGSYPSTPRLMSFNSPTFQNKFWKREFIHKWKLLFAPSFIHEDEILWRQACAVAQNIQFISDKLYFYLQRNGSIMHSRKSAVLKAQDYCQVIRSVAEFYEKHHTLITDVWRAQLARSLGGFYDTCLRLCTNKMERTHVTREFANLARQIYFGPYASGIYPLQELSSPPSLLSRLFFKRAFNKTTYCFLGIPVWTIRTRKNKTVYRLLGIPVWNNCIKLTII